MNELTSNDVPLPVLRNDLHLTEGPVALDGSPSWIIFDPLRNKYFSIGWAAFQLLSRWSVGKASLLIEKVKKETSLEVDGSDIENMLSFLYSNSLTLNSSNDSSNDYLEQYLASKPNFLMWLVHNYLFIKIPLVKPTRFLRRTLVYVEPIFSKTVAVLIFFLGLIGLYMVGRQWDSFTSTFLYFYNFQGLAFYFLSLLFIKILHELAHAYTVIRFGSKVPTMGVAFLVMFPILYTDTSDTWRVKSARERMYVGAAGMIMELYIACIATFCWAFLPEGILKSATFILATTSWVLSLAINSNALMRFDGYYILSDLLGIQNLQARSFAVGKWRLTELLFGLKLRPPEALPASMLKKLYIYAWCVWIYRFFLFLGIAILVYYFFFKLLGIILFLIEIIWFIVLPVLNMMRSWWDLRKQIMKTRRFYITATIVVFLLGLFIYPWNTSIKVPAIFKSELTPILYTPTPGYIETNYMTEGKWVDEGDILLKLRSPQLEHDIDITQQETKMLQLQAKRIAASAEELSNIHILIQRLQESRSRLNGLYEMQNQLVIRAPISGYIYDVEKSLHPDRWINQNLALAAISNPVHATFEGVITEDDLQRIKLSASAKFVPDNPELNSVWGFVREIEQANLQALDLKELASTYGGKVPVQADDKGNLVPDKSVYRVRFEMSLVEDVKVEKIIRGVVHVEGEAKSFLKRASQLVSSVFIRESGF